MTTHDAHHASGHDRGPSPRQEHGYDLRDDESVWDARYAELDRVWSGDPNLALTVEVAGLSPGRALDVGCGEGADAVWLATHGWEVTALDPSGVALDRARAAADAVRASVHWVHAGLAEANLPTAGFDLVSVFYPALDLETGPVERLASLVGFTDFAATYLALGLGFDPSVSRHVTDLRDRTT